MFSWYQKRDECTFIFAIKRSYRREKCAAWSRTSIDIPEEPHSAVCEVKGPAVWLFGSFQCSRRVLLGVGGSVCQHAASEQDSDDADEHPDDDVRVLDER